MTKIAKLYASVAADPGGLIAFREFERLLRAFGFVELRQRGSHRMWHHPDVAGLMSIQPRGASAKPYQVRVFLDIVNDFGLKMDE